MIYGLIFKLIAMKNLLMGAILLFGVYTIQAQSYDGKGDMKLNIGYDVYGIGNGIKTTFDYGLGDLFSIGAGVSFYFSNEEDDYFVYARTNVHLSQILDLPQKLDIYPGVEVGYLSRSDIGFSGYIGIKYFFTERIGIMAEIGNNGSIGVSINL